MYHKRTLSVFAILVVFLMTADSFSQTVVNSQAPNPTVTKDFSVKIVFTKAVLSVTATSITLYDGTVINLRPGTTVPAGVKPGVLITVVTEVERNGFTAESIAIGNKPAPIATTSATQAVETKDALESTAPAGTEEARSADCSGKTTNVTTQQLANAFSVNYQEVNDLHCNKGYGYDDIARAYVLAKESRKAGKPITVMQILSSHDSGKGWDDIRKDSNVKSESLDKSSTVTERNPLPRPSGTQEAKDDKGGNGSSSDDTHADDKGGGSSSDDTHKDDKGGGSNDDSHKDDKGGGGKDH